MTKEQQIRFMAVLKEKDVQVQAALTRNLTLSSDLAVAIAKIKELEDILSVPPSPPPKQDGAEAVAGETVNG